MPNNRILAVLKVAGALLLVPCVTGANASPAGRGHPAALRTQDAVKGTLAAATDIKCAFSLIAVGGWGDKQPRAEVKPVNLVLQFEAVNADEGSAQLKSGFGVYDIVVRYAPGYLHFIQSFRDGPLYTTTVLEKATSGGKLKAMHSRHEYTDVALTGFTSSPEQYYGECEILKPGEGQPK